MSTLNVSNLAGPSSTGTAAVLSSVNGGPISGARNRIINGSMAVDQRNAGATQTLTAGAELAYTVDRWYAYCVGANVNRDVRTPLAGTVLPFQKRNRFSGASGVTTVGLGQRIEAVNSIDLIEGTVTISAYMNSSLQLPVTWTVYRANTTDTFGTLASPTRTQVATGTWNTTTTYKQFTASFALPESANTGLEVVFTIGALTSGTWEVGAVQLEPGTVATPFERRSYGQELALCQRYYQTTPVVSGSAKKRVYNNTGVTTPMNVSVDFPVTMRATPTLTVYGDVSDGAQITLTGATAVDEYGFSKFHSVLNTGFLDLHYYIAAAEL